MRVILLQELKGRGGEGDVIDVTRGFAVNFLLPKKIAVEATAGNLKQLELRKHNIAKRETERLDTADKIVNALNGKKVTIPARVGEEGQLFGSVTAPQIAEAIAGQYGVEIDRRKIDLKNPIKKAGEHQVSISIYREVRAAVTVEVVDENAGEAEAEAAVEAAAEAEVAPEGEAAQDAEAAEAEAPAEPAAEAAEPASEPAPAAEPEAVAAEA
jgi:large subunit ribosomal protein L9